MDGCIKTSQIVCTCDKNILYAPIPQAIQYGCPELCTLVLADPHAQNIFAAVQIKADGNVHCFLYDLPFTADIVVDRIQKNYGIDRFQRPLLLFFRHRQDLIRDPAYRSVRHRQSVDILNMRLDVASHHAFRIHGQDLLFDILTDAGLVLFQKLRFKFTLPVTGSRNLDIAETGAQIFALVGLFCFPWPEQALRANIHCQISLALNRIYTEWYPSKGYTFNITNSTSYDQYYVHGRTVFEVMVRITDDIFNTYLRKRGTVNPYYSEYCDGKSVTCPGLKQWGTVTLANNGRSALQILRYYYGSSIEIVRTKNIRSIPQSYPGTPLRQGSRGTAVFTLQRQLNRITKDYPFLGKLTVDGVFGSRMAATVRAFQKQFNLTADGVVGRQTWYKISYIYVSVKDLAELTSEGETSTGTLSNGTWNGTVLSTGASGSAVEQVQFWLNTLAQYDSAIPSVKVDGVFGTATANAVRAFQRKYGLTVDGIVGQTTWKELYDEFLSIQSDNGTPNAYPGTPLREGSSGQNVRLVQFWLKIARTVYTSLESVTVDGKFGAGTAAAVRRFQRYFGLTADGVVGRTTWQKMYEVYNDIANRLLSSSLRPGEYPGVLRSGSTGTAVRELQFYLYLMSAYESSIPPVSIDGKFGADTERAVRAYQRFAGLTVDGVVGRTTWNSLYGRASQLRSSGPVVTLKRLPYPGAPLTVGSSGETVLYYNLLLQRIAYYFSSVEAPPLADRYTDETATATRSAQQLLGLEQTGIADADTWTAVEALSLQLAAHAPNPDRDTPPSTAYPGRAIAEGSAGQEVGQVERWLNRRAQLSCGEGYVADNNRFGASDAAAVRAVQQQAGLQPVNGIVYRETWHALQAQCTDPCGCEKEE